MFQCSPLTLPPGIKRESTRSKELRPTGFDVEFDSSTLFYDVIFCPRSHWCDLIFVGPPPLNLLPLFWDGQIGAQSIGSITAQYFIRDRCWDVWIPIEKRAWGIVPFRFEFGSYALAPQRASSSLYKGRRVLYTLSKDNDLRWILDWTQFHVRNHGADGILLYDNSSTKYTAEDLERTLRLSFPELEVNVVNWPYKYGPQAVPKSGVWDSDFCQTGALQDARFRFLGEAASVLNCDIDELVLSADGESIFEATERSETGCTMFRGNWISNVISHQDGSRAGSTGARHSDFRFLEQSPACPIKWCAVPRRCRLREQWATHGVFGKDPALCHSNRFFYRHFRGISTHWKYQRDKGTDFDPAKHRFDDALDKALRRATELGRAAD